MDKYIKCRTAQKAINDLPAELDAVAVQRCSETIHNLPAEDVVAVVRCGECAYCEWKNEVCTYGWCKRISTFKMRGEYCSDGERRDGDDE